MIPFRNAFLTVIALASFLGCASTRKDAASDSTASAARTGGDEALKASETATKRAGLERQLAIAREKLTEARVDAEVQKAEAKDAADKGKGELELAKAELTQFDERDAPTRIAKAKLDLQDARDALSEQQEELAQLEATYAGGDLADKTREIVLNRGKRRVARAQQRLAIQERETSSLEQLTIPRERGKLELEVQTKTRDLQRSADAATAHDALSKRIAILSAEAEVARLEADIAALATAAKP